MANNLISDVMKMATPAIVDRVAAAFGVNANVVRNVLASAVPAVFAGLATQASSPSGLNSIMDALRQANPNLGDALSGVVDSSLASSGTDMLRQVLGDGVLSTIVNSVTKNTGASAAAGSSLVAIAGQMAMSALAKHAGGDASGVASLLASQASLFQSSLPASLAGALGSAGAAAAGAATRATAAASGAAASAARTTTAATTSAANTVNAAASGGSNWLMWLIPVIIIAGGLWWYLGHKQNPAATEATPPAQTTSQPATTAPAAPAGIMVDNVDVSKTLGDSLGGLTAALGGVTDATTAQAAIAKVQDAAKGITTVSGLVAKFTPDQKTAVAALVSAALPALKETVAKVEAIAGVGDVVKPVIDPVVAQLDALAKG